MRNALKMGIAGVIFMFALPALLFPCYQVAGPPTRISNEHLKVKFTYNGKPLAGAVVMLSNPKANVSRQAVVDKDGWATFSKVKPGNYRLIFDGPSHETFEVVLEEKTRDKANSMYVNFYADYCQNILVRGDLKEPEF
jgi:hypothetical protein